MKYKKDTVKKIRLKLLSALNKALPKYERALVIGFPNVESSAVSTANYIAQNYALPVTYVVSKKLKDDPRAMLEPGIRIIPANGSLRAQAKFFWLLFTSKYLFLTHGIFLDSFSKRQVVTNIWHGILYKKIGLLLGGRPIPAHVTVGTSVLTQKMFSEAFGVPEASVFVSGYPRNDHLLQGQANKKQIKLKLGGALEGYKQVMIWMPTFRKNMNKAGWQDGIESGNPFYIENFDVAQFNQILKASNAYCLVKPHPMAVKYADVGNLSHMKFIDDQWISDQGLTLYQLVGSTDVLISDVSSVVIDYLLLDQPILCVSTDFEAYKQNRGFYFEAIEDWLPGPVLSSQALFFGELEALLKTGRDGYVRRRKKLKKAFFMHHDARSTERLVQHVLDSRLFK